MIEFFDVLPAKTASLNLFFEENGPEKGWVVRLEGNESEIIKTEIWIFMEPEWIILKICPFKSRHADGEEKYWQCPIHILVFMVYDGIVAEYKFGKSEICRNSYGPRTYYVGH